VQGQIAQTEASSVGCRAPSYGLFKTSLTPEYWYGIPRNVKADGFGMDVDRFINQRVDKENNQENWRAFNRAQGARMSAMEHLVPEQMFSTEEAPANGISAVKAIQLAAAEGQKIYTITQANLSIALQQLQLSSEIKADIRNAVSAGMEVTTHQQPVNFFGNQSVGYILLDPNTGAGAYRIGGGENGSELYDYAYSALNIIGFGVNVGGTLVETLAVVLGAIDDVMKKVFKGVAVFGLITSIIDVLYKCAGAGLGKGEFMIQMIQHVAVFIAIVAIASLFTPLMGILLAAWSSYFLGLILEIERVESGCDA
jgi:hypothetical protein